MSDEGLKMPKVPADHLAYLRLPFDFRCWTSIFPPDEMQALSEYGNWMEALAGGQIQPVTPEQEHFLLVDRDQAEPATVSERAWVRLKGRREYEQEQLGAAPPPAREDYGMVEWDQDRCWW